MSTGNKPTLAEVIKHAIAKQMSDVHTAIPARVEKYDATKQRVDAKPLIKVEVVDENGDSSAASLPVVVGVPVQFPGGGGYRVTFPIAAGDTGLLVFTEASIDKWLSQGGEVDPLDYHRFHLADGVFIPGVRPFATPLASAPTDRASLGKDGGLTVDVTASDIRLGGDAATERAVLGDTLKGAFDSLKTAVDTATTTYGVGDASTALINTWVTAIKTAIDSLVGSIDSSLSSTVKLKP